MSGPLWKCVDVLKPDEGMQLLLDGWQIALAGRRVDGLWLSQVNRHLRDWRRHRHVVVHSRALAMKFAFRWCEVNLMRIATELPSREPGPSGNRWIYPPSNPDPREDAALDFRARFESRHQRSGPLSHKEEFPARRR